MPKMAWEQKGGISRIARESVRSVFLALDHAESYSFCCCNLNQTEVLSSICWVDADDIQHDGLGELNLMKSVS